jgi:hypothetical protein
MSDQTSIFGDNSNPQATPANVDNGQGGNPSNSQNADPVANLLGSIKNEKGEPKYKSLEDALVALQHSQTYIPQLTAKLNERETELTAAKKEAERVAELERSIEALTLSGDKPSSTGPSGISEEAIAALVNKTLSRTQQEALQKNNLESVVNIMKEQFGDKAEETFYGRAKELGMSVLEFNSLAAKTPKAVLNLMGVKENVSQANSYTPPSVNGGAFTPNQQSFIGRNSVPTLIGATSQDLMAEATASRKMVEELHAQGKSVHDLSDPKVYMKTFKK